jgi:hypothetical protein
MEMAKVKVAKIGCYECGMVTKTPCEYHPWIVCDMFKAIKNGDGVRAAIRDVIEYGAKAERYGISVDDALANLNLVIDADTPQQEGYEHRQND